VNQKLLLRVWPEWSHSGIWVIKAPNQTTAGAAIKPEHLNLPKNLAERFEAWGEWLWDAMPGQPLEKDFDWDRFTDTGRQLAIDLSHFLGPSVRVEYLCGEEIEVICAGSPQDVPHELIVTDDNTN